MSEHLPRGWTSVVVEDLVASRGDLTDGPFGSNLKTEHYQESGPRVIRLQNIGDGVFLEDEAHISAAHFARLRKHEAIGGDIVVAMLGSDLPRACAVPPSVGLAIVKADCVRLRPDRRLVNARYVAAGLNSPTVRHQAKELVHGVGRPRLGLKWFRTLRLPLAPIAEQARIVDALDSCSTRLDAAIESLEAAQKKLKGYRASVLKAAVEGRLVPTEAELARREGRSYESADVLLERFLKERRHRWEQAQLARMTAAGKTPKDDKWKAKYKAPAPHDITWLPNLPKGWCWAALDALLEGIDAGKNFSCEERPPSAAEIGVVKVSAVTWGTFNENESKTCTRRELANLNHLIRPGDFLFSRANTLELVGACVIAGQFSRTLLLSDKILRLRLIGGIDRWLMWVLRSFWGRREIESLASGNQLSMRNLSQDNLRRLRIPIPPLAEIERIVEQIDVQFSIAEETTVIVSNSVNRAARLRQAVLKSAFDGQLVDQDLADEPAEVLLARVRNERAAGRPATHKQKGRRKLRAVS
jgi:type I restriction enzyme, S subunit